VKVLYERERSNLLHSLRILPHKHDVPGTALALQLFFDGCRYRSGFLLKKYLPREEAAHLLHFLIHNVPHFDPSVAKQEIETWPDSP
jgi:hypothetical protein